MSAGLIVIGDPERTHGYLGHVAAARAAATRFDNSTDTWTVVTADGQTLTAQVLVDATPSRDDSIAVHGHPNRFRIPGPHTARQARYVARCIDGFHRSGSTRIEARSAVRVHRVLPTRALGRFYLTGPVGCDDVYDGPAVVTHDGRHYPTRVRLSGRFDPIDGHYHWQGTLDTDSSDAPATGSRVDLRIGEHTASARISEQTPWGTLSVVGVAGHSPFRLPDGDVAAPPAAEVATRPA